MKVDRVDIWVAGMKDKPGTLAAKLEALAESGVNLAFVLARRAPEKRGTGVVFVAPIKGAAQARKAKALGFHKSKSVLALRVEGPNKAGQGACMTAALAANGINLRGLSACVIGRKFAAHIAVDRAADATKAARVLRAL